MILTCMVLLREEERERNTTSGVTDQVMGQWAVLRSEVKQVMQTHYIIFLWFIPLAVL